MEFSAGVLFALVALVSWGFGDFLISRSTKKFGDWETLFVITAFGAVALTPFVYADLGQFLAFDLGFWILLAGSIVIFFAALLDFEALKQGKLAIVEPMLSLEVPLTVLLAFLVLGETMSLEQGILIGLVLLGLLLVSLKHARVSRKLLEKGVLIGAGGAVLMGTANFLIGYGSRLTSPLLVNWFMNVFIALACLAYILAAGRTKSLVGHVKSNKGLFLGVSILDNGAWIAYAFAIALAPFGLVIAISESYIALSVLLGLLVNRERIHAHQKIGLVLALAGVILLASL